MVKPLSQMGRSELLAELVERRSQPVIRNCIECASCHEVTQKDGSVEYGCRRDEQNYALNMDGPPPPQCPLRGGAPLSGRDVI